MDFRFNDEQRALKDLVRRFVEKEMPKEKVAEWDAQEQFPEQLLEKMAEIGLMGATVSEEFGGTGGGVMEEVIVLEELARHSSTVALAYGMDVCFGAVTIAHHGTESQRQEFLPKFVSGKCHFALSMTEPDGGTDILGSTKTVAREDGDYFVITGAKVYTTGLSFATHIFVVARTSKDANKPSNGLTVFSYREIRPEWFLAKLTSWGRAFFTPMRSRIKVHGYTRAWSSARWIGAGTLFWRP